MSGQGSGAHFLVAQFEIARIGKSRYLVDLYLMFDPSAPFLYQCNVLYLIITSCIIRSFVRVLATSGVAQYMCLFLMCMCVVKCC
jgi:hypothetical protein